MAACSLQTVVAAVAAAAPHPQATRGSANFGKIINVASTPFALTEAHHCNVDASGKVIRCGAICQEARARPALSVNH